MTHWLIAINVAVFVADVLLRGLLTQWGALSSRGMRQLQLWRFISFQFLHAGPLHILFNMMWLWLVGPVAEGRLGRRRYLVFYLMCGVASGLAFLLQWQLLEWRGIEARLVGASGAVFGVMAAAVLLAPQMQIRLMLLPVGVSLRVLFWILVGMAGLTVVWGGFNRGGEAAHLGGAAMGYLLMKNLGWLQFAQGRRKSRFWTPGDPNTSFFRKDL